LTGCISCCSIRYIM